MSFPGSLPFVFEFFARCRRIFSCSHFAFRSFLRFSSAVGEFFNLHISLSVRFWLFSALSVIFSLSAGRPVVRFHRQSRFSSKTNGKLFSAPSDFTDRANFYQKRTEIFFEASGKSPTEPIFIKNERKYFLRPLENHRQNRFSLKTNGKLFSAPSDFTDRANFSQKRTEILATVASLEIRRAV